MKDGDKNAGADAVELNMHCIPYSIGANPQIVKGVKEGASIRVIPKMTVPWEDPGPTAKKLEDAGVDALPCMGTYALRAQDIDVEQKKFYLQPTYYS